MKKEADICIISEGSYPYYSGGVAQWVHELITEHKERTFHVLTLVPPHAELTFRYKFPPNVIDSSIYTVQYLPKGSSEWRTPKTTWKVLIETMKGLVSSPNFEKFEPMIELFENHRKVFGKRILCESPGAWNFFLEFYKDIIPTGPFKSYFGTIYTLTRSLFSILLPELPKARLYHALCTGYAGFILYRAKKELGKPCFVTEQGIYSNERRIEIAMADWIAVMGSLDLAIEDKRKTLKDFWLNAFYSMAHACYLSCDEILSTYDGNHEIQLEGGADPKKVRTIVHGINQEQYLSIQKKSQPPPAIAFIGRIVPIKDIKTFIRACKIVKAKIPDVQLYALGPYEEDPEYYKECQKLIDFLGLSDSLKFSGKVNIKEYFPKIDLLVLTSLSEAQPLVILEAGAVGIPCVATNVGGCEQLLYGSVEESPRLGKGGIITPLVDPEATANAIIELLTNRELYQTCSSVIKKRIQTYYVFQQEHQAYRELYAKYLGKA